jgi:hypothetical protein
MKKLSVIIASLLFVAGVTLAQTGTMPGGKPNTQKTAKGAGSGTTGTVKKVPATKTTGKATPTAKTPAPAAK